MNFKVYYDEESVNEGAKILYHYYKTINKKNRNTITARYNYIDWSLVILIILILATTFTMYYIIRYEEPDIKTIIYNVILYLFIWFVLIKKLHNQSSYIKKKKKEIMQSTTVDISEQEIRINRENNPNSMLWTEVKEVAINPHCVILISRRSKDKAIILPIDYKDEIIRTCQRLDLTHLVHNFTIKK